MSQELFEKVELLDANGFVFGHAIRRFTPKDMSDYAAIISVTAPWTTTQEAIKMVQECSPTTTSGDE